MKLAPTIPTRLLAAITVVFAACNRTAPSEPGTETSRQALAADASPGDGGIPRMTLAEALGLPTEKAPPPAPPTDADFVKLGQRDIDWGLDKTDPAADYVERYVQSTQRYGSERTCVHAQPSRVVGARTLVETRDQSDEHCHGTGAVRDTFAIDVAHDHLSLADPAVGKPLEDWPDGSNPEGMPAPAPKEGPGIDVWQSPLTKALKGLQLVPLRVQFYGRGSYALISLAGWHPPLTLTSPPAELASDAKKICEASAGFPVGLIATMDRATVLRIRCPGTAYWEHL